MGKNKLYSMVLSLAVAVCLWLYVSQNVSRTIPFPISRW